MWQERSTRFQPSQARERMTMFEGSGEVGSLRRWCSDRALMTGCGDQQVKWGEGPADPGA